MTDTLNESAKQVGQAFKDGWEDIIKTGNLMYNKLGVTFTPEQEAAIRKYIQDDDVKAAQSIILDALNKDAR